MLCEMLNVNLSPTYYCYYYYLFRGKENTSYTSVTSYLETANVKVYNDSIHEWIIRLSRF